jgi:hypothetical protein
MRSSSERSVRGRLRAGAMVSGIGHLVDVDRYASADLRGNA